MRIRTLMPATIAAAVLGLTGCSPETTAASEKSTPTPSPSASESTASPTPSSTQATPTPTPTVEIDLSSYAGKTVGEAIEAAEERGLEYAVYLARSSATVTSPGSKSEAYASGEKVCRQLLDAGEVNDDFDVAFLVAQDGHDCDGKPLPKPKPKPVPAPQPQPERTSAPQPPASSTQCGPILSNSGNCYNAGQFCRNADVGSSTRAANGRIIYCRDGAGQARWQY
ncbi:hypothetical protein [Streptomyces apocyni]|uniref:hypothetical protein n=1 Tax=Streptomyces apocyni TaxID=2654677 RepID=UPI0012EA1424|nr:hypothetical protein [Streptomyces apocyni]